MSESAHLQEAICKALSIEYCSVSQQWWIPAEPCPIACDTRLEAVHRALRLYLEPLPAKNARVWSCDLGCANAAACRALKERLPDGVECRMADVNESAKLMRKSVPASIEGEQP